MAARTSWVVNGSTQNKRLQSLPTKYFHLVQEISDDDDDDDERTSSLRNLM